jgi:hypothetical protein
MSVFIQLEDRPADERVDFLRETSAALWMPTDYKVEGTPRAAFRASGMGAMQVVVFDTAPITVYRLGAGNSTQAEPLAGGAEPADLGNGLALKRSAIFDAAMSRGNTMLIVIYITKSCPTGP